MDHDRFGNPMCGQSFMAGTICSDRPGHGGGHSCLCQQCRGDWMNGTCQCQETWCCEFCEEDKAEPLLSYQVEVDDGLVAAGVEYWICRECYESREGPLDPSDEDMDYVLQSLGIRTSTTDSTPPAFSSPLGETEPSRKGQA